LNDFNDARFLSRAGCKDCGFTLTNYWLNGFGEFQTILASYKQ